MWSAKGNCRLEISCQQSTDTHEIKQIRSRGRGGDMIRHRLLFKLSILIFECCTSSCSVANIFSQKQIINTPKLTNSLSFLQDILHIAMQCSKQRLQNKIIVPSEWPTCKTYCTSHYAVWQITIQMSTKVHLPSLSASRYAYCDMQCHGANKWQLIVE